jgi:hypothetical protein
MADSDEESYRTYGDYRRAKDGAPSIKRERRAPPRDMNPDEPAGKRFRANIFEGQEVPVRRDDEDDGFQPSMMSFKAFLDTQDDSITDEEALTKYGEYKLEFRRQQLNEFFVGHKEEEWFRLKYHPLEVEKRRQAVTANLQRRLAVFSQLVLGEEKGVVGLDMDHEKELVGLLDRVVVCLEGGEAEDLEHLAKVVLWIRNDRPFLAVFRIQSFWASRIWIRVFPPTSKNPDFICFVIFNNVLSLKTDEINLPRVSNKQKELIFRWHLESH